MTLALIIERLHPRKAPRSAVRLATCVYETLVGNAVGNRAGNIVQYFKLWIKLRLFNPLNIKAHSNLIKLF